MTVDTESQVASVSYLRVEAAKGCWLEQFTDTTTLGGLSGNWCIDADISK